MCYDLKRAVTIYEALSGSIVHYSQPVTIEPRADTSLILLPKYLFAAIQNEKG